MTTDIYIIFLSVMAVIFLFQSVFSSYLRSVIFMSLFIVFTGGFLFIIGTKEYSNMLFIQKYISLTFIALWAGVITSALSFVMLMSNVKNKVYRFEFKKENVCAFLFALVLFAGLTVCFIPSADIAVHTEKMSLDYRTFMANIHKEYSFLLMLAGMVFFNGLAGIVLMLHRESLKEAKDVFMSKTTAFESQSIKTGSKGK